MQYADRVKETTSSTGTGPVTLAGLAAAKFRTFGAAFTVGDLVPYCIEAQVGGEWEAGIGTLTAATTLARTTVTASSNANNAVNFPAGVKDIVCTLTASELEKLAGAASAAMTTISDQSATYLLAVSPEGLPRKITIAALLTEIGVADGALPAAGALLDSDIMTVARSDGTTYRTTYGVVRGGAVPPADTTAPVLTSATSASTGPNSGSGSVTTSEGNGTLYYVASTSASGVTATAIKAGASLVVSSTGSKAVTAAGLAESTAYYLHFLHRDAAGNDSSIAISPSFTTAAVGDTTAPSLTLPTGAQSGATTATGSVTTNEANGTLYYLASINAVESSTQVKAAASKAVTATGAQDVNFVSLTGSTTYYPHYLHRDAAGNDSTVSSGAAFTTPSAASYTFTRSSPVGAPMAPVTGKALTAVGVGAGAYNNWAANSTTLFTDTAFSFGVSPVPPDGVWLGCGTSNTSPPPLAPAGTSTTSSTLKVPGGKLLKGNTGTTFTNGQYYSHPGFLFQEGVPGVYNWYYWLVTSDGVALCLNPNNPIVITLTAS